MFLRSTGTKNKMKVSHSLTADASKIQSTIHYSEKNVTLQLSFCTFKKIHSQNFRACHKRVKVVLDLTRWKIFHMA